MMVSPPPQENAIFNNETESPVYEHRATSVPSPFQADENSPTDISFAAEATDETSFNDMPAIKANEEVPQEALKLVEIEKTSTGFGFNIVGGIDNPHFAGDIGIFVSSVNPHAKSYGIVQQGDKILTVDGIDMTYKTHDEAVDVFRSVKIGHVAKMLIDREYVSLLEEDRTQSTPTASASIINTITPLTPSTASTQNQTTPKSTVTMTPSDSKGRLTAHGISAVIERIRGKVHEEEDAQSVTSYAPSTHDIIDDVPRTPRKPLSLLDPRNNSWITEALYVSIGLGALTLSGFLVYRFIRGRK